MERCRRTSLTMSPNPQHHLGACASGPQVRSTACTSASASPPLAEGWGGAPAPTYNAQTDIIGEPTVSWVRGPPARRYGQRLAPQPAHPPAGGGLGGAPTPTYNAQTDIIGESTVTWVRRPPARRYGQRLAPQPAHPPACGGLGGAPAPLI